MKNMTANMTITEKKMRSNMRIGGRLIGAICLIVWGVMRFVNASTDTAAINALLERRAAALNQKDLTQYLDCFSVEYRDGSRTYHDLKADAEVWFSQFDSIQFSYQTVKIERSKHSVTVENHYHFVLNSSEGKPVNIANKELLEVRQDAAGWKITASLAMQ